MLFLQNFYWLSHLHKLQYMPDLHNTSGNSSINTRVFSSHIQCDECQICLQLLRKFVFAEKVLTHWSQQNFAIDLNGINISLYLYTYILFSDEYSNYMFAVYKVNIQNKSNQEQCLCVFADQYNKYRYVGKHCAEPSPIL